jgi:beta-phosphoglucomutase
MSLEVKAFLFDLDGVIVDTARYHYLAWREIAAELGFAFTERDNERLKGVSRTKSLDILLQVGGLEMDETRKTEIAARKNERYLQYIQHLQHGDILPGAEDFLIRSREAGLRTGLVSASKNTHTILRCLEIEPLFDAVVDGNGVKKTKPDPEGFLVCSAVLGLSSDVCVVFEDAVAGIAAAKAAGMFAVGIGSAEILTMADFVVAGLNETSPSRTVDRLALARKSLECTVFGAVQP